MITGVNSTYNITTAASTTSITPNCADLSGTVTYSLTPGTSSDSTFWNAGTHTWSFTPIFEDGGTIKNFTFGCTNGTTTRSASTKVIIFRDFSGLVKYSGNPIIPYNTGTYNSGSADSPYVRESQKIGDTYYALSQGNVTSWCNFNLYTSTDLKNWTPYSENPVLTCGASGQWDDDYIQHPSTIKIGDTWYMYYAGGLPPGKPSKIGIATSSDFIYWTRSDDNPIYLGRGDGRDAKLPSVIKIDNTYYMYYTTNFGQQEYATSLDGIAWTYGGDTIIDASSDWDYAISTTGSDPFVIQNSYGFYEQVYTAAGGETFDQHLGYAISSDGINWHKYSTASILEGSGVAGSYDQEYPGDGVIMPYENYFYLYWAAVNSNIKAQGSLGWIQSTTTGIYQGLDNTVYADGATTYSVSPNGFTSVPLTITPSVGSSVAVTIITWNTSGTYSKEWTETGDTSAATASHTVGNLQASHYYTVTTDSTNTVGTYQANGSGQITFNYTGGYSSHTFNVNEDTTPPTNIGISSITPDSTTQLTVTAQTATDAGSGLHTTPYWFAETTDHAGASSSVDYQTSTAFVDTGLSPNTQYTYKVRAKDANNNVSSYSTTSSKYTLAPTPTNLTAGINNNLATLTVDSFTNDTTASSGYYFQRTGGGNSGWIQTNTWQDTGLECGQTYTYAVQYRNGDGTETSTVLTTATTSSCFGGGLPNEAYALPAPPLGGFSILINNGLGYTNNPTVTLNFNAGADVVKMAISNFPDFLGTGQEPFQSIKQWNLCQQRELVCPSGEYTVYAKFYTSYGQSSKVVQATIFYTETNLNTQMRNLSSLNQHQKTLIIAQIKQQLVLLITQLIQMLQSQVNQMAR